jgi:protein-tyrosine phosphatase
MTPTRVLAIDGACNFRDCGGYETVHGSRVRWGRVYRSGLMSRLSPRATAELRTFGLRAVCDLRRNAERIQHPNPEFGEGVRRFEWDTQTESSPIRDRSFAGTDAATVAHAAMLAMYERLPYALQPRLAGVFTALEHAGEGATIVHCAAGKDRTGVAIALVLEALGVPRATVVADYTLTNTAVDLRAQLLTRDAGGAGLAASADPLLALSPTALDAVLAAHPDYLMASLAAIDSRHGSVHGYLQEELGVRRDTLQRLRDQLTE